LFFSIRVNNVPETGNLGTAVISSVSFRNWTDAEETVVMRYIACAVILTRIGVIARVNVATVWPNESSGTVA